MLEAFLGSALRARGADAHVHSAGTMADGRPAVHHVVDVSAQRGHDISPHRSRLLDRDLIEGADLVLPLAREHLREIVVTSPEAFPRTFTPKELVRRAAAWLIARQRADGGWGEDGATYWPERRHEAKTSTPSQTAWALLGLMAAGEVRSDGADGIACWFIDTDYNEESFFVRHAYFLGQNDPYGALKTTLKAEIDADTWATLNSDISRPFPSPRSGRIAVKVINHLGDEVMKVFRVEQP